MNSIPALHPLTREALEYKATVAEETVDSADPETAEWADTAAACNKVARDGSIAALKDSKIAQEELENYLQGDREPREIFAIVADLCRAGYFEVHDPKAFTTRRPKTRVVDGIRYDLGSGY